MRTLSAAVREAINAQNTSEVFVTLLTITYPTFGAPLYVCDNGEDVTSRGNVYVSFPFQVYLPEDSGDRMTSVALRISNIDRRIIQNIRLATSPPIVAMEVIAASEPDTLIAGPIRLTLRSTNWSAKEIEGTISPADLLNRKYPKEIFNPTDFPGLF